MAANDSSLWQYVGKSNIITFPILSLTNVRHTYYSSFVDTKTIISEIKATGLTHKLIAKELDCSKATVDAWSIGTRGKSPSHELGQRLLALYNLRCKQRK